MALGGSRGPVPTAGYTTHMVTIREPGQRLIITGQIGSRPEGGLEKGLKSQLERAFTNLFASCERAGFGRGNLVKVTAMVTEPGRAALFREVAAAMFAGHNCPVVYVQVAGLSAPTQLCELEGEAVKAVGA